jgi:DNA ligase 1
MSCKRPSSPGASSSQNNKRVRRSQTRQRRQFDQPSIDSFFGSSRPITILPAEPLNSKQPASASEPGSSKLDPVIIDVDQLEEDIEQILPATSPYPASERPRTASVAATTTTVTVADQPRSQPEYPNLSVDPASFNLDSCFWPSSTLGAPYSFLAHALCSLSATRSRIAILNTLTNALRALLRYHPPSLLPSLYLLSNSLAPPYVPVELGLGPSIISKAIQHVSGVGPAALKRLYNQTGDAGDVAFLAKCSVRTLIPHPPLSIQGVYNTLLKIAHIKGKGAVSQKQAMAEKLLVAAKGEEIRYLVRTLSQHIRVGAVRTTILTAFSRALVLTPPATSTNPTSSGFSYTASPELVAQLSRPTQSSPEKGEDDPKAPVERFALAEALLKKVYVRHPNYDHIVSAILQVGLDGLAERVPLTVGVWVKIILDRIPCNGALGVPLQPTLGSPMRSLDDVYGRVGDLPFTAEFKYDGQRAQIHAEKSEIGKHSVSLFSRHLEDMTEKVKHISRISRAS